MAIGRVNAKAQFTSWAYVHPECAGEVGECLVSLMRKKERIRTGIWVGMTGQLRCASASEDADMLEGPCLGLGHQRSVALCHCRREVA